MSQSRHRCQHSVNLALFALIDVIRAFNSAVKPADIRAAAILVPNPSTALAFLDQPYPKEWVRVIGAEARPLPANVVSISQFQNNATDLPWSHAMSQLTGSAPRKMVLQGASWS